MSVDPRQHRRYLAYLKKYEYFGHGRRKLGWDEFVALESEIASADRATTSVERTREAVKLLLED